MIFSFHEIIFQATGSLAFDFPAFIDAFTPITGVPSDLFLMLDVVGFGATVVTAHVFNHCKRSSSKCVLHCSSSFKFSPCVVSEQPTSQRHHERQHVCLHYFSCRCSPRQRPFKIVGLSSQPARLAARSPYFLSDDLSSASSLFSLPVPPCNIVARHRFTSFGRLSVLRLSSLQ